MKKSEGITLVSLIITIIILLILASIATYSGMSVVNSSKLTAFTTELKIMQTQVNAIYQEKSDSVIGEDISDLQYASKVLKEAGITSTDGYRYWSKQVIKKDLGIEGVEQDFFVNVGQRSVVSYQGFEYEGKTYYTLDQLPNGLYNVEYENSNEKQKGPPTFEITTQCIGENKYRVSIQNVQYGGYIDKWEVNYQLQGESNWKKTEDMSFVVNAEGTYKIKLTNGLVSSKEEECEVK